MEMFYEIAMDEIDLQGFLGFDLCVVPGTLR